MQGGNSKKGRNRGANPKDPDAWHSMLMSTKVQLGALGECLAPKKKGW